MEIPINYISLSPGEQVVCVAVFIIFFALVYFGIWCSLQIRDVNSEGPVCDDDILIYPTKSKSNV